jgi:hypothetical protein
MSHNQDQRRYYENNKVACQARTKEWRQNNREQDLRRQSDRALRRTYGMSLEEYERKSVEQNNLCAICFKPETTKGPNGKIRRLSVDHSHLTGRNRKLLCAACNAGLGWFQEDVLRLQSAIQYLLQFQK